MLTPLRIAKVFVALALLVLLGSFGVAGDITFDAMAPSAPGTGKIQASGSYTLDTGETLTYIKIYASPTGGGGGLGGRFDAPVTSKKTWSGTIENLAPDTEYDVQVVMQYLSSGNAAAFTKTVKVKTGK